jgi:LacI family transcriptional regulator
MPSFRLPTVYDVAKNAGVSIATVSRVLNSPELVKNETRRKVLTVIDELGFVPKADASARARRLVGRIGILTPFFTMPSFIQRMRGIAATLVDTPFELVIYPVDSFDRLEGYLAMLPITRRLDGMVIMALPLDKTNADRLLMNRLETVLIEIEHPAFTCILIDDRNGGEPFLGPDELPNYSIHPEDKRLDGYCLVLEENGIPFPAEYTKFTALTHPEVHQVLAEWIELPKPPSAVFAASDDLAIRLLRAARERGLKVPEDLAIIGFDDIDMAEQIGLTTVNQSLDESGRTAIEHLLALLENHSRPVQHIQLGLRVIERETA